MFRSRNLALLGAVLLIAGAFLPVAPGSSTENVDYLDNVSGLGGFILALGLANLLLVFVWAPRLLWLTGGGAGGVWGVCAGWPGRPMGGGGWAGGGRWCAGAPPLPAARAPDVRRLHPLLALVLASCVAQKPPPGLGSKDPARSIWLPPAGSSPAAPASHSASVGSPAPPQPA